MTRLSFRRKTTPETMARQLPMISALGETAPFTHIVMVDGVKPAVAQQ
jgi:hypothetical protein